MIPMRCCICGEAERLPGTVVCKNCKAEIVLTEGQAGLKAIEALHELPSHTTVAIGSQPGGPMLAKAIKCESCGKSEVYNPQKRKASYFCDLCGKQLCTACAAYCNHKDWNYQAKIVCKLCRAETSLTGQPVEEVEGSLPGQGDEVKRVPKPHCGRATCVEDPEMTAHPCPTPGCDHKPFCECKCPKCREAVASGFVEPMFGKMPPDPDPEPPKPPPAPDDEDLEDEMEAHRREAEQA